MYSPAVAPPVARKPYPARPLSLCTQLMARGPGWRLAEGEARSFHIKLCRVDDPVMTWAHMLRTLRSIADTHGLRPVVIDLREAGRLAGPAAEAAALVFAEFESEGLRVATVVGADIIHAARLHRLLGAWAPAQGRCYFGDDEAIEWVRRSIPSVPPPLHPSRHAPPRVAPPRV